jgi:integrase
MGQAEYWKRELAQIIDRHNERHKDREKVISHATRQARRQGIFRIFVLLHQLGFRTRPRNFSARHVQALMAYWTAKPDPTVLRPKESTISFPVRPYSAAYIQQQLSFLRAFTEWIGKRGLVLGAERYVADRELVARHYCAKRDLSWGASGVEPVAMIERVARIDKYVAVQLRMMMAFGLRRKEAVMFAPQAAQVPQHALPDAHRGDVRHLAFLRVKRGTKGGRLRYTAVRTPEQREALAQAVALARGRHGHIGRPGLSLKQSLDLFSNVVRQVGLTKKQLGVTPHGLRHQFAGDLFFDLAQVKAPVRGGEVNVDFAVMQDAYRQVARQLGHNRPQISNAYLGSPCQAQRAEGIATVGGLP